MPVSNRSSLPRQPTLSGDDSKAASPILLAAPVRAPASTAYAAPTARHVPSMQATTRLAARQGELPILPSQLPRPEECPANARLPR